MLNPNLLRRPTRVKANTDVIYIYSPSIVTENPDLPTGTAISIVEVTKIEDTNQTLLVVVKHEDRSVWNFGAEKDIKKFHVLLKDIGK